jgi:hypothetical protein
MSVVEKCRKINGGTNGIYGQWSTVDYMAGKECLGESFVGKLLAVGKVGREYIQIMSHKLTAVGKVGGNIFKSCHIN